MNRIFYALAILTVVLSGCMHYREIAQRKVTFVLYDAREARSMLPIFDYLRARKVGQEIIAIGPAQAVVKKDPDYINLQSKCGLSDRVGADWPRELPIPSSEMDRLRNCV